MVDGGVRFRVVAPAGARVSLVLESEGSRVVPMVPPMPGEAGRHTCFVPGLRAGALYRYRIDDGSPLPDPASRFQPDGPHGPSEVIDPTTYLWRDADHRGVSLRGQVVYELHIGTFTREGTFAAAARELGALAEMGITLIELMPLADFPGDFGWGYDGVDLFAPPHVYGRPDALRAFVDEAHRVGLGVILDVVYNHLGPDGAFVPVFYESFFSKVQNDWGQCINFDGEGSQPVRELYLENAAYWIREYHLDGLRLDATQDIHDTSDPHILREIVRVARQAAGPREIVVIAENEPQQTSLVRGSEDGGACDALWNDDFHHSAMAAATGHTEAYYSDTAGTPQELISSIKWGYLYQGQYYSWQKKPRGQPGLDLEALHFVFFLQNHDQVANSARGRRLHALTSPGRARALKALLLLAPGTPMLFQGEEFDSPTPFYFFADHNTELAELVRKGRVDFLSQFPSSRGRGVQGILADPGARATFEACKLDGSLRSPRSEAYRLTRALLHLRKTDPVFRAQDATRVHGAVLGDEAFVLRYLGQGGDDRLVLVNLGRDLPLHRAPEPLLAPPRGKRWRIVLSTEDPELGGSGLPPLDAYEHWRLHGHSTTVLGPEDKP
jgi:maltooligosyltrehalose trehalohydrolase